MRRQARTRRAGSLRDSRASVRRRARINRESIRQPPHPIAPATHRFDAQAAPMPSESPKNTQKTRPRSPTVAPRCASTDPPTSTAAPLFVRKDTMQTRSGFGPPRSWWTIPISMNDLKLRDARERSPPPADSCRHDAIPASVRCSKNFQNFFHFLLAKPGRSVRFEEIPRSRDTDAPRGAIAATAHPHAAHTPGARRAREVCFASRATAIARRCTGRGSPRR